MLEIIFKPTILDRPHKLVVNSQFLKMGFKDSKIEKNLKFNSSDIEAFRYGIKWIKGVEFTIGRIYCIDVKAKSGEIISIRLKSLYGINKELIWTKYSQILDALSEYYFDDLCRHLISKIEQGDDWHHKKIVLSSKGIELRKQKVFLQWPDVGTKIYSTYYAIYSKSRPDIYQSFEFLDDWNTGVVYSLTESILKKSN